jgi:hypothetical protein
MKSIASLSLDLDNKWSYLKTHGDPGWDTFPSYFDLVVPRILNFLEQRNLTITFFIVGQDAALKKNRSMIRAIADAGHEIGNHSFLHEPWLHLYSEEAMEDELSNAEGYIENVTAKRPVGFRGPGFSMSETTLRVLARRGYEYDATAFPNILNPLARTYFFWTSNLSEEEKRQRKALFGTFSDAFRPVRPFKWRLGDTTLTEIPVTTMPVLRLPLHFSYLLYLSRFVPAIALSYFRVGMRLCRWTGTQPSLLLHPLDFLDYDDEPDLAFFPAMNLPCKIKMDLLSKFIDILTSGHNLVTIRQHAESVVKYQKLPLLQPRFAHSR